MKKLSLSLSFAVVLMCLMVACSSDPDVESGDVLVIKNTPFATVAPTVKAEIIHSRSEEHTSELQSLVNLVCRLLLEKKK